MRFVISIVHVDRTPDSEERDWLATALWVDEVSNLTGQWMVGPGFDPAVLVAALSDILQDVSWPWLWLPEQHTHQPRVEVAASSPDVMRALKTWAHSRGWAIQAVS
jgi:hypothetical protein